MKFSDNIKALRLALGFSKETVAVHLGITVSNFEKYESGKRSPPLQKGFELAKFYHVTLDSLLNLETAELLKAANATPAQIQELTKEGFNAGKVKKAINIASKSK